MVIGYADMDEISATYKLREYIKFRPHDINFTLHRSKR